MDRTLSQRIISLLRTCSIELSPRDAAAADRLRDWFDPGTMVFVSFPPSVNFPAVADACMHLRRAGFVPVPHVVARRLPSFADASEFLRRVADDAAVTQILLLGGDTPRPAGPFDSALALLATGAVERYGITSVAFAGYPEGHPQIANAALQAALHAKLELAASRGLAVSLITQFGFDAQPILNWIAAQRAAGVNCPIRIGLAGPASVATLAKYAVRCGIGASLRALTHGHTAIARILAEADPGPLVEALANGENPATPIDALHFFCFGSAQRTAAWLKGRHALGGSTGQARPQP
ncbi:MAG TPA: methylenetetrahydrofolate reductase [Acetobacteraceae bacterium]|nr:methylenetetrahydrofolate reductase [Acetobacteraceae bacterium]